MSSFSKYGPPVLSAMAFIMFLILICLYYLCFKPRRKAKKAAKFAAEARRKAGYQDNHVSSLSLQTQRELSKVPDSRFKTRQTKYSTCYDHEDYLYAGSNYDKYKWQSELLPYCIDLPCDAFTMNYYRPSDRQSCSPTRSDCRSVPSRDSRNKVRLTHESKPEQKQRQNVETTKRSVSDGLKAETTCKFYRHDSKPVHQAYMSNNHGCCRLDPCNHRCFQDPLPCIQELTERDNATAGHSADSGYED